MNFPACCFHFLTPAGSNHSSSRGYFKRAPNNWKESGAGKLNEFFLRSNDISFPERIFVDTNALMVKLVAEGVGWAFTRPTTVLQNLPLLPEITVAQMQKPDLSRTVYLMGRESEFVDEAKHLEAIARDVVVHDILPKVLTFAPWVEGRFYVAP